MGNDTLTAALFSYSNAGSEHQTAEYLKLRYILLSTECILYENYLPFLPRSLFCTHSLLHFLSALNLKQTDLSEVKGEI